MTDAALHHSSHVVANALLELAHAIRDAGTGNTGNNAILLQRMAEMEQRIMATQQELTVKLQKVNDQLRKMATDSAADTAAHQANVDALKAKIEELKALVTADGEASPELVQVVNDTETLTQAVDDSIPEAIPAPPPTQA